MGGAAVAAARDVGGPRDRREIAQRDLEARLANANEDHRAAEVERDALRHDKEGLITKVKTLQR